MFAEDLSIFFANFAQGATWAVGTSTATVNVIHDPAYIDPLGQFEGVANIAYAPAADWSTVAQGHTLTINGTAYTIVEVMPHWPGAGPNITAVRLRT